MILYDVSRYGPLETPVDNKGLVDLDALVTLVRQTVDPAFSWASPFNDIHHLQWFGNLYPVTAAESDMVNMHQFRELVTRKAFLPRVFHNWAHRVTLPPPVPSPEVMRYSITAHEAAMALYRTTKLATKITRMPQIPEKKRLSRLNEEYENYVMYVENAREVPIEFSLFAIEEVEARSIDEMLEVNKHLGRLALDVIPIRHRKILQAA